MKETKRLPRKLKKQLRRQGVNPKEYLERLRFEEQRGRYIDKIFTKDYENAQEVVQEIIGGGKCI